MVMRQRFCTLAVMACSATTLGPALARDLPSGPARTGTNATIAGIVLDADGKPAARAVVVTRSVGPNDQFVVPLGLPIHYLPESITANSEIDGTFAIDLVPDRYAVFATTAGGTQLAWRESVDVAAHEKKSGIELQMRRLLTVRGHVESSHPGRFGNKAVSAYMFLEQAGFGFQANADTDAQAAFTLRGLMPGTRGVTIESKLDSTEPAAQ